MKQKYVAFFAILFFALSARAQVLTGLDNLAAQHFAPLKGKHIGLITNQTGRSKSGEFGPDIFLREKSIKLVALFAPEHGLFGTRQAGVESNATDTYHGVKVYSLYGSSRKPTKTMLKGVNALVFDMQDIGVRPYTYLSTMVLAMEAAAENKTPFYVLDRPNPLSGNRIEGNILDPSLESFVGAVPVPYLHGMTLGELAKMAKAKSWFKNAAKLKLNVIPMTGWKRSMYWPETGLAWTAPSPNIPHFENAVGCAMLGATGELGVLAIGVGTDAPFLHIGSTLMPTSTVQRLADSTFGNIETITPENFSATSAGMSKNYNGVRLTLSKPLSSVPSIYTAQYKLLEAMMRDTAFRNSVDALPQSVNAMFEKVTGMHGLLGMLRRCEDLAVLFAKWQKDVEAFRQMRAPFLLYK
jgi:uncharacterized protein YbbC (DUF1343 family)